jgi:hypothetical protein
VDSKQWAADSGQKPVGSGLWAMDRKTIDIKQWAGNNGHGTVGSGQRAVFAKSEDKKFFKQFLFYFIFAIS